MEHLGVEAVGEGERKVKGPGNQNANPRECPVEKDREGLKDREENDGEKCEVL